MSCLGVLFSLDNEIVTKILSQNSDGERLNYVQMEIEENYFDQYPDWVTELDKSWDSLHRCLTDGNLEWHNGSYPLNHMILGGQRIYHEPNYIMTLKAPEQVRDISRAIAQITKDKFRELYFRIDPNNFGMPLSEDDFQYTWAWFLQSIPFWSLAAKQNRNVLFTADQ